MQFINAKFIISVVLILSLGLNVAMLFVLVNDSRALSQNQQVLQSNGKILSFTELFIEKVLTSGQEVDFDTRLELETMVRNLNDAEILSQWQRFTGALDNYTASIEAKSLLNLLVKKISR